jgi:hypothetical protein
MALAAPPALRTALPVELPVASAWFPTGAAERRDALAEPQVLADWLGAKPLPMPAAV